MCKKHAEPLELFCRVDQMFVCETCRDCDHKTHEIVSLEEEAEMRKTQLGIEKKSTDQMIQALSAENPRDPRLSGGQQK